MTRTRVCIAPIAILIALVAIHVEAQAQAQAQPSRTCHFMQGPKAGQSQFFPLAAPMPIGTPCQDGISSAGAAVPDAGGAPSVGSSSFEITNNQPSCRVNGQGIPYLFVAVLPKSGLSTIDSLGSPVIYISSVNTQGFSPPMLVFLYAHECGHHALGHVSAGIHGVPIGPQQELAADCFAKHELLGRNIVNIAQFNSILNFLANIPGDPSTYPGPYRAQKIGSC